MRHFGDLRSFFNASSPSTEQWHRLLLDEHIDLSDADPDHVSYVRKLQRPLDFAHFTLPSSLLYLLFDERATEEAPRHTSLAPTLDLLPLPAKLRPFPLSRLQQRLDSGHLSQLAILRLNVALLTEREPDMLAHLLAHPALHTLEELALSGDIPSGVKHLPDKEACAMIVALERHDHLDALRSLALRQFGLDQDAITRLQNSVFWNELRHLDLSYNAFTLRAMGQLVAHLPPHLETLSLYGLREEAKLPLEAVGALPDSLQLYHETSSVTPRPSPSLLRAPRFLHLGCLTATDRHPIVPSPGDVVGIGRKALTDEEQGAAYLQLDHDGVSRTHARLIRDGLRLFIQDLGSTNGVYIDNERVAGLRHMLGSRLTIANYIIDISRDQGHHPIEEEFGMVMGTIDYIANRPARPRQLDHPIPYDSEA